MRPHRPALASRAMTADYHEGAVSDTGTSGAEEGGGLVTALVTVHNGEGFLRGCIESLQRQSLQDLELVVVLDGCDDGSAVIAREISKNDRRLRVIDCPRVGRSAALNIGLAESAGEFVAILDCDDRAYDRRLELQREVLLSEPWHTGALASGAEVSALPRDEAVMAGVVTRRQKGRVLDVTRRLLFSNPVAHSSVMFRRQALDSIAGYDVGQLSQVDYDLYVRLADAGWRLKKLDIPLVNLATHEDRYYGSGPRFSYCWNSLRVQRRAGRVLERPSLVWVAMLCRAAYFIARSSISGVRSLSEPG